MRFFLFFLMLLVTALGFGWYHGGSAPLLSWFETVTEYGTDSERFRMVEPTVLGVSEELRPVVAESRQLATSYRPQLKEYSPRLTIVSAHASVIMDVESGEVLYERNAHEPRQIASLTKLFTAALVMERVKDLDELVTIDEEAVYAEGTRVGCPRSGF